MNKTFQYLLIAGFALFWIWHFANRAYTPLKSEGHDESIRTLRQNMQTQQYQQQRRQSVEQKGSNAF